MSFVPEFIRSYAESARKVQEHWSAQLEETVASVTDSAKDRMPDVSEEKLAKGVDDFFDAWVNAIESQRDQTKRALAHRMEEANAAKAKVGELEERGRAQAGTFMEAARSERDAVKSRLEEQLRNVNEQFQSVRDVARRRTSDSGQPTVVKGSVVNEPAEGQPMS